MSPPPPADFTHHAPGNVLSDFSEVAAGRRPYRLYDEHQSSSGRWEMWMDADQARALSAARGYSCIRRHRGP